MNEPANSLWITSDSLYEQPSNYPSGNKPLTIYGQNPMQQNADDVSNHMATGRFNHRHLTIETTPIEQASIRPLTAIELSRPDWSPNVTIFKGPYTDSLKDASMKRMSYNDYHNMFHPVPPGVYKSHPYFNQASVPYQMQKQSLYSDSFQQQNGLQYCINLRQCPQGTLIQEQCATPSLTDLSSGSYLAQHMIPRSARADGYEVDRFGSISPPMTLDNFQSDDNKRNRKDSGLGNDQSNCDLMFSGYDPKSPNCITELNNKSVDGQSSTHSLITIDADDSIQSNIYTQTITPLMDSVYSSPQVPTKNTLASRYSQLVADQSSYNLNLCSEPTFFADNVLQHSKNFDPHSKMSLKLHQKPHQKRPRRKYNEIERIYQCGFKGCKKSYGTLNHLNAHIHAQSHGKKRKPEEFKETRIALKARKQQEMTKLNPVVFEKIE